MSFEEKDPDWVIELVSSLSDKNINNLSEHQKKMLRDQYLENLEYGLKAKEAMEKAFEIVLCFNPK